MASDEAINDRAVEKHDAQVEAEREAVEWADDDACERCGHTPASLHSSGCWLCSSCARHYDEEDDL